MKIPETTLELGPLGYEGYWIKLPRSVKEGFVYQLQFGQPPLDGLEGQALAAEQARQFRDNNIKVLSLVSSWNIDDDEGKVLPTIASFASIKDKTERFKKQGEVVAEIPAEILKAVVDKLTANATVSERTKGF